MQNLQENISANSEENEISKLTTSLSSMTECGIQPKKVIAKLKKSKSKQYKKKVLYITSQIPRSFTFNHKFLIFGFVEIETFYKDFKSMYDDDLIMLSSFNTKVIQVEKKNEEKCLQLSMGNIGNSGLKDFQFLIDHFQKSPDQDYQYLAEQLQQYQLQTNECVKYLTNINKKVKSRIISEQEVQKAEQDYDQYFRDYVKQNYKDGDFYTYGVVYFDFETQDILQKYSCISYSVLSLLGLEPEEVEQSLLHSNISFSWLIGTQRLQNTIRNLVIYNSELQSFSYDQKIMTADSLEFMAKMQVEIVKWPNSPDWIGKYYMLGLVNKIDVSLNQLKAIIDMRQNQTSEKICIFGENLESLFEYTVQSEIFIEKFYPDLFQNHQAKKSLTLKKQKTSECKEEQ